jgi:hypothetical protein
MLDSKPITTLTAKILRQKRHYKRKNAIADQFELCNYHDIAQKLHDCRETEQLVCCNTCGGSWYATYKCHLRVCPICSWEESRRRTEFVMAMCKGMKHPKLLTLTLPQSNTPTRDEIIFIRKCFTKLRRSKAFRNVVGGSYQIECKPKPEGFHVHIHALLDAPYLPRQHIWSMWKALTGNYCPQVDIRSADTDSAKAYVCKYAAKSAEYESMKGDVVRWYEATKNSRLFATFGKWYRATIESVDPNHVAFVPHCVCPHCGDVDSNFRARDGPWMFPKAWLKLETLFVHDQVYDRPIEEVKAALLMPDLPYVPADSPQLVLCLPSA